MTGGSTCAEGQEGQPRRRKGGSTCAGGQEGQPAQEDRRVNNAKWDRRVNLRRRTGGSTMRRRTGGSTYTSTKLDSHRNDNKSRLNLQRTERDSTCKRTQAGSTCSGQTPAQPIDMYKDSTCTEQRKQAEPSKNRCANTHRTEADSTFKGQKKGQPPKDTKVLTRMIKHAHRAGQYISVIQHMSALATLKPIPERTISLRFLGIILRGFRLEVSVYNV
jgi:hypothetical protein